MTQPFYDELAPYYHLLYGDWGRAVKEQGEALSALLQELGIEAGACVHDAACGIGTQTLSACSNGGIALQPPTYHREQSNGYS